MIDHRGTFYMGWFRDDKFHGYGKFFFTNAMIGEGLWANDFYISKT